MKRKENKKMSEVRSRKPEDQERRPKSDPLTTFRATRGQKQGAKGKEKIARNPKHGTRNPELTAGKNSTVKQNMPQSQKDLSSPVNGEKIQMGKRQKRLILAKHDISREEEAITARGFLRFFNN